MGSNPTPISFLNFHLREPRTARGPYRRASTATAFIAQLGERQTEDLKVPSSILGEGTLLLPPGFVHFTAVFWGLVEHCTVRRLSVPYSLVGQDTWFSPTRPGFDSRWGKSAFLGLFSLSPCVTRLSRSDGDTRGQPTGSMAEWLRRLIRNQLGVARGSSNLSAVDFFSSARWWNCWRGAKRR